MSKVFIKLSLILLLLNACGSAKDSFLNVSPSQTPSPPTSGVPTPEPDPVVTPPENSGMSYLSGAKSISTNAIEVSFTEEMDFDSVQNMGNYMLNQGLSIVSITVQTENPTKVIIQTDKFLTPKSTLLTISNVKTLDLQKSLSASVTFIPKMKLAFLSNSSGNGNFSTWALANGKTGIEAINEVCTAEARAQGYLGDYYAWVSSSTTDAQTPHLGTTGGWVTTRPEMPVFAESIDALIQGRTMAPIYTNAQGSVVGFGNGNGIGVVTSTNGLGLRAKGLAASGYCNDWTSSSSSLSQTLGNSRTTGAQWTLAATDMVTNCGNANFKVFCLQKGNGHPTPQIVSTGRKVFVTSTSGTADLRTWGDANGATVGTVAADNICKTRATVAGLANAQNFKAWVSSATLSARDKFVNQTGAYVNTRGVVLGPTLSDVANGTNNLMKGGIAFDESGNAILNGMYYAHTGTAPGGVKDGENHCSNWESSSLSLIGTLGGIGRVANEWTKFISGTLYCGFNARLVCIDDSPI